jgi:hypothetical protein
MTSMTEHPTGTESIQASRSLSSGFQDLNKQCLRILRCTAEAFANSPGGLRFKSGTRPWLAAGLGRRDEAGFLTAAD